jgi:hypothetical protein
MKRITAAGNTLVPAILALERAGFVVEIDEVAARLPWLG